MASVFDEVKGSAFDEVPSMSLGDVASGAFENFIPSAANIAGATWEAVTSPISTAKTMLDLGAGMLQNALPEGLVQYIGEDKASRDLARSVGKFYVGRYGSIEGVKQAVAKDPVGVMADLSTVLGVGGATLPGKVGAASGKVAGLVDPVQLALKATTKPTIAVAKAGLEKTTGVGKKAMEIAYESGKAGGASGQAFRENLRGQVDPNLVIDTAKNALRDLKIEKNQQYQKNKTALVQDKSILDFADIDSALNAGFKKATYNGEVTNQAAYQTLNNINQKVQRWKSLNPSEFHTPEGLDALKQSIRSDVESLPFNEKTAIMAGTDVYNSVKDTIIKQAPVYNKMMKDYSEASDLINEIEKSLSIGNRKTADASLRKLQSVMRNNVNANFGQRLKLTEELQKSSGQPILPALAGQAMTDLSGRGMAGNLSPMTTMQAGQLGGIPAMAVNAAASSPRVVGEVAHKAGQLMGLPAERNYGLLMNMLYQSQLNNPQ